MGTDLRTNDTTLSANAARIQQLDGGSHAFPAKIEIPDLPLTQSGQVATDPPGKPLIPGLTDMFPPGYIQELTVTGLDPSGVHPKRTFELDDKGVLNPFGQGGPIGASYPYEIALV